MTPSYLIGSFCTGIGGLDLAVAAHFDARAAVAQTVNT